MPIERTELAQAKLCDGCIVMLLACWSQANDAEHQFSSREIGGIAENLLRAGASAVVGFTDSVDVAAAAELGELVAKYFLGGLAIDEAVFAGLSELRTSFDGERKFVSVASVCLLGNGAATMKNL